MIRALSEASVRSVGALAGWPSRNDAVGVGLAFCPLKVKVA